jgi:hypothetical protein
MAGALLLVVVPLPNCPSEFEPHAAKVPSAHNARLKLSPAATAVTVLPDSTPVRVTSTGTGLLDVLPLPNWPNVLYPHAVTVPSAHAAKLK